MRNDNTGDGIETREITVEVDTEHEDWLAMTAREYGLSVENTANKLIRFGLIHHEEAVGREC